MERVITDTDGRVTMETTDNFGNTNTEIFTSDGSEYLGDFCVDDEDMEDFGWCYEDWIDADGNHHHKSTDPDGNECEEVFYLDGTFTDCDGNTLTMDGATVED